MSKGNKKLEGSVAERKKAALPFFVSCKTHDEACKQAGISRKTFYEWLKDEEFKADLDRMRDEIVNEAVQTLKTHMMKAVCVLVGLLEESGIPALKRHVANDIIAHVFKARELQEFEKRLIALEQAIEVKRVI